MQPLFSTDGLHPTTGFRRWQEALHARRIPVEQTPLDQRTFEGRLDAAEIGSLTVTRIAQGAVRSELTPATIRRFDKGDTLVVVFKLAGQSTVVQDERSFLNPSVPSGLRPLNSIWI